MTHKIAIFYHCLFAYGDPPSILANALSIVYEQMAALKESGLLESATELVVGVNGGPESHDVAKRVLPPKSHIIFHGLQSRSENLTLVEIEKWAPKHPGWKILYFHSKGVTHTPGSEYHNSARIWRKTMMLDLVHGWRKCVDDLWNHDIACSCWEWGMADGTQNIPCGNFLWVNSNFVVKLPSIYNRARIKQSGISSFESRYEAEVHWGNGPRPTVKQYRPNWRPWEIMMYPESNVIS